MRLKSHWRLIFPQLFYLLAYISFLLFAATKQFEYYSLYILAASISTLLIIGPSVYLHLNYYLQAKKILINQYDDRLRVFEDDILIHEITRNNIKSIDIVMSPTFIKYNNSQGAKPWELYNYAEIESERGRFVLNNLIFPNIKKILDIFPDVSVTYHSKIFASI